MRNEVHKVWGKNVVLDAKRNAHNRSYSIVLGLAKKKKSFLRGASSPTLATESDNQNPTLELGSAQFDQFSFYSFAPQFLSIFVEKSTKIGQYIGVIMKDQNLVWLAFNPLGNFQNRNSVNRLTLLFDTPPDKWKCWMGRLLTLYHFQVPVRSMYTLIVRHYHVLLLSTDVGRRCDSFSPAM